MSLLVISVTVALSISALCSMLEATLLSYSTSQVSMLSAKRPVVGRIWQRFKDNIEKPIAVILVLNTAAHTIGATFAGAQFELLYGEKWLVVFSIVLTYVMLQFTEILPKTMGVRYNHVLAPLVAPPLNLLVIAMRPILWFIHLVNRPFERSTDREDTTLEEIAALAANARLRRVIEPRQAQILDAASRFESLRVRQIMTPRVDIEFLTVGQPVAEVLEIIQRSEYTRLPLCEDDIDHPVGMVHVKDVLRALNLRPAPQPFDGAENDAPRVLGQGELDLSRIKREVIVMPGLFTPSQALAKFQEEGIHLAIVVDEFGQTQGIVTLEDVIEEIVGDIRDEFDESGPAPIRKEGQGYRVRARVSLHELAAAAPELNIDHLEAPVHTVGGYMTHLLHRLPAKGDSETVGGYRWTVTAADPRRVREVLIEIAEDDSDAGEDAGRATSTAEDS